MRFLLVMLLLLLLLFLTLILLLLGWTPALLGRCLLLQSQSQERMHPV